MIAAHKLLVGMLIFLIIPLYGMRKSGYTFNLLELQTFLLQYQLFSIDKESEREYRNRKVENFKHEIIRADAEARVLLNGFKKKNITILIFIDCLQALRIMMLKIFLMVLKQRLNQQMYGIPPYCIRLHGMAFRI